MALAFHERLIALFGGAPGLIDEGRLDAALASPKNQFLHASAKPDVFQLAAAYAHALTRDHPFVDGNKRMALVVCGVFLELNGFRLEAPEGEAVRATDALSSRELEEQEFANWLRDSSKKVPKTKSTGSRISMARAGRTAGKRKSTKKRAKKAR
jgi:death on curing protein